MAILLYVTLPCVHALPCIHALISAIRHVLVAIRHVLVGIRHVLEGAIPSFSVPHSATKSSNENVKNLRAELMGEVQDEAQEEQEVHEAHEEQEVGEAHDGVLTQGGDLGGGPDPPLARGHDMPQET